MASPCSSSLYICVVTYGGSAGQSGPGSDLYVIRGVSGDGVE